MRFKVSLSDKGIQAIVKAAFPSYKGRRIAVEANDYPLDVTSYWSGGSRSYFAAIDMRTLRVLPVPQNGTVFEATRDNPTGKVAPNGVTIPVGFAIVEHLYFGQHQSITIHVNPASLPAFLPAPS